MGQMKRSLYEELMEGLMYLQKQREIEHPNFVYYDDEGEQVILNGHLLHKQNVSEEDTMLIGKSHILVRKIFNCMESCDPKEQNLQLRRLAELYEEVQFFQQLLWGFPQDRGFHFWANVPWCECGKMDAQDTRGTPYRHIMADCPVHGCKKTEIAYIHQNMEF